MKKALIIEDNENNMALISFLLEKSGYEFVCANTGQAGYNIATDTSKNSQPDFIILDIQLPDIEGTEVLRMLKGNAASADIPIIAMTSYAMAGDRERLLAAGCSGYIEKPIDPLLVVEQIEKILEQSA